MRCGRSLTVSAGDTTVAAVAAAAPKAEKKAAAPKAEAKAEAPAAAGDDLTAITGVGPAAAKKLNDAGILTYADLAAVNPETFEGAKVKAEWVEQAKTLA